MSTNNPQEGTLEVIFSKIDEVPSGHNSDRDFELFMPSQVTLNGQPVDRHKALDMIREKLQNKGYQSDSFTNEAGGSRLKYISIAKGNLEVGYYIELQRRLFEIFLDVSCDERNFGTFSIALASTFLDAGSYFDSLSQTFIRSHFNAGNHFKAESRVANFSDKIKGDIKYFNMGDYRTIFEEEFAFSNKVLNLNTHGDDFYSGPTACFHDPARRHDVQPFKMWTSGGPLEWWEAYTKVKHDRIQYMHEATLGNTLKAFGAVLIVLTFYKPRFMKRNTRALETYRLFTPRYWKFHTIMMVGNPTFESF